MGQYLASQYNERMAAADMFAVLHEKGRFGEKAGAGWYDYPGGGESAAVKAFITDLQAAGKPSNGNEFSVDRLMMPMLNEAFRCVDPFPRKGQALPTCRKILRAGFTT